MSNYIVIKSLTSGLMPGNNEILNAKLTTFDVEMCQKRLYLDSVQLLQSGSIGYTEFLERTHDVDFNSKNLIRQIRTNPIPEEIITDEYSQNIWIIGINKCIEMELALYKMNWLHAYQL
jgi:hypothetical protein